MGTRFLAINVGWVLWVSMPWICLICLSTIMLGWHYALDGIGVISIALISVIVTLGMKPVPMHRDLQIHQRLLSMYLCKPMKSVQRCPCIGIGSQFSGECLTEYIP